MEAKVLALSPARGHSPSLETAELRQKIFEMTTLCKQLQDHVEYLENKMTFTGGEMSEMKDHETSNSSELSMVKEKLKELVAMNMNWQKHNTQQEKIIRELNEKIKRLEREMAATRSSEGQLPESQQIEYDQILLAKKHLCNSLEEEKTRFEEENHQLKQKVASLQTRQEELSEVKERCQLLEAQLLMYQEDFKTERSDRERAQSKNADLEQQVAELKRQLIPNQETSRTSRLYSPYDSFSARQPREEMIGRGVMNVYQTDGPESRSALSMHEHQYDRRFGEFEADGRDETDAYQVVVAEDVPNCRGGASDELSCPKCHRSFLRNRHLDLVEHMEVCH